MEDMVAKRRHATHDPNYISPVSRFSLNDIERIFELKTAGKTAVAISKIYEVNETTIARILNGKTWRNNPKVNDLRIKHGFLNNHSNACLVKRIKGMHTYINYLHDTLKMAGVSFTPEFWGREWLSEL